MLLSPSPAYLAFLLLSPACISGWLSQLRPKQRWVTTIPNAQRPQTSKHWLSSLARSQVVREEQLQVGAGLGFCSCVFVFSLDQLVPSHQLLKETESQSQSFGGRIRRSPHTILSRQCLSWPWFVQRAEVDCCGIFIYTVKMCRCVWLTKEWNDH